MIDRFMQSFGVFSAWFDDSELVFMTAVGLAIGLFAASVFYVLGSSLSTGRRRVRAVVNAGSDAKGRGSRRVENAIAPVRSIIIPKSAKEVGELRKRLVSAGHRNEGAMAVYYVWKLGLALTLGVGVLFATTFFPKLSGVQIMFISGGAMFVGSLLPSYVLDKRVAERKRRIVNAFPDMLDMLVACSEAGLGLNAALQRVARELALSFPDLAEELELVNAEMLAGVDRVQALRGFSARVDIPEISGFVSMLSQSLRFGTGIADTLRIYADDFRDQRMQAAEEMAAKVGTKLLFPLVLCIFPCFFVVAVGPAVISVSKAFAGS